MVVLSQNALASCNPADIKKVGNAYSYPVECHVDYGRLRQVEEERKAQIKHLNESIKLKDLALDVSNKRIKMWQDATYRVEDRLMKVNKNTETIKWIYFGLGIIVMGAAVAGAGNLR